MSDPTFGDTRALGDPDSRTARAAPSAANPTRASGGAGRNASPARPSGATGRTEPRPAGAPAPSASGDGDGVVVRPLATLDEYRACVALQRATWGEDFSDVVPLSLLKVCQRIGGVTAGAFDERGALLGFVFGMTGVGDGGELVHWSDMLAVRRDHRNMGLGRRLKEYQRETLRALGVRTIYWTFDPLVARNAHLNLNKLGACVAEYVPDMYGATDSPLHRGLGTDRFIAAWAVGPGGGAEEPVERVSERDGRHAEGDTPSRSEQAAPAASDFDAARLVNPVPAGEPATLTLDAARRGESPLWVQIPSDIRQVQQTSLAGAAAWRDNTRAAFLGLQELGYEVVGFEREDASGPCRYVLAPSDPTADPSRPSTTRNPTP